MQRAKGWLRQRFKTDRPAAMARARQAVAAQRLGSQPLLCLEIESGSVGSVFALGRRVQRCLGRMTRRRRHCANVRVFFQIEDASPRRPGVFGRAGSHPDHDGSRNKRESGHLRPRFASRGIILPSSATRDSTRTHSVPQPAATSFGKSLPLPAFLLLSLRDALRYQAWRGWQRTSGLAHARPPHGIPQPRRG